MKNIFFTLISLIAIVLVTISCANNIDVADKSISASSNYSSINSSQINITSKENSKSSPRYHYSYNVDELLNWIKNANENDPRKLFLNEIKKRTAVSLPVLKNSEYKLDWIAVHPDYSDMWFLYKKSDEIISVKVHLLNDDEQKEDLYELVSNTCSTYMPIEKYSLATNKNLADIPYYYRDFFTYDREVDGIVKSGNALTCAYFKYDFNLYQIEITGHNYKDPWDEKYLSYFNFEKVELLKNEEKSSEPTDTSEVMKSMPRFYHAKSIQELILWIKNSALSDPRKLFLSEIKKRNEIIIPVIKNTDYLLEDIIVHPSYLYCNYKFTHKNNIIYININLLTGNTTEKPLDEEAREYEKNSSISDIKYSKSSYTIGETNFQLYYLDGGSGIEYKTDTVKKYGAHAFFDFFDTRISCQLTSDLTTVRWSNDYLDYFRFDKITLVEKLIS